MMFSPVLFMTEKTCLVSGAHFAKSPASQRICVQALSLQSLMFRCRRCLPYVIAQRTQRRTANGLGLISTRAHNTPSYMILVQSTSARAHECPCPLFSPAVVPCCHCMMGRRSTCRTVRVGTTCTPHRFDRQGPDMYCIECWSHETTNRPWWQRPGHGGETHAGVSPNGSEGLRTSSFVHCTHGVAASCALFRIEALTVSLMCGEMTPQEV